MSGLSGVWDSLGLTMQSAVDVVAAPAAWISQAVDSGIQSVAESRAEAIIVEHNLQPATSAGVIASQADIAAKQETLATAAASTVSTASAAGMTCLSQSSPGGSTYWRNVQNLLCARACDPGVVDGVVGPGVNPDQILGGQARRFLEGHGIQSPLFVYLGAMAFSKGTVQVVEGIRRLWQEGVKVELVLAGAILSDFGRYLEGLSVEDRRRIRVLGPVDEVEKRDLLAAADVVAMPSRTDSFGLVYLEAWLYGKPVIGAQTWGVRDVIDDGGDGILVPFGDPGALARALSTLLSRPDLRAKMGERGEAKVYRFHTWDIKYATVSEIYAELVRTGKSPPSTVSYGEWKQE